MATKTKSTVSYASTTDASETELKELKETNEILHVRLNELESKVNDLIVRLERKMSF